MHPYHGRRRWKAAALGVQTASQRGTRRRVKRTPAARRRTCGGTRDDGYFAIRRDRSHRPRGGLASRHIRPSRSKAPGECWVGRLGAARLSGPSPGLRVQLKVLTLDSQKVGPTVKGLETCTGLEELSLNTCGIKSLVGFPMLPMLKVRTRTRPRASPIRTPRIGRH
jgi:hypothetical protein